MTPCEFPETAIRRFTENGCEVTAIVADPADAQQTLYGTVTHNGHSSAATTAPTASASPTGTS